MNNALIAIGGSIKSLREPALKVAKAVGKVEVDHGKTGCKTPDAARYIEKMVDRASKRTRVTGARSTAKSKPPEKKAPGPSSKSTQPKAAKKVAKKASRPAAKKKPPPKRK